MVRTSRYIEIIRFFYRFISRSHDSKNFGWSITLNIMGTYILIDKLISMLFIAICNYYCGLLATPEEQTCQTLKY